MATDNIKYEVVSLPNKSKLSHQLLQLVEAIEFLLEDEDGKKVVDRSKVYGLWLSELGLEANDKVFASYIHQLIQFGFMDRLNVKPKKELTVEQLKKQIEKQMKLLAIVEANS